MRRLDDEQGDPHGDDCDRNDKHDARGVLDRRDVALRFASTLSASPSRLTALVVHRAEHNPHGQPKPQRDQRQKQVQDVVDALATDERRPVARAAKASLFEVRRHGGDASLRRSFTQRNHESKHQVITVDFSEVEELTRRLEKLNERGFPHAVRMALNDSAFKGRELYRQEMRSSMTLRNRFTEGSVRVQKARGMKPRRMESAVGSIQPYMRTQEEGGTERKRGKVGVAIPTSVASREGRNKRPKRRIVRRMSQHGLGRIELARRTGKGRKQRNAIAIAEAKRRGRKHVFLDLGRRKGIFRVGGGRRSVRIDMVWDLSRRQVRIPKNPMLRRATTRVGAFLPRIHEEALRTQINAVLIFGKRV